MLSGVLSGAGMEVACAQDDRTAYSLTPTLPTFTVLIVDVNLGAGTTGFDVARFARRVIPQLRVIYMRDEAPGGSLEAVGVPEGEVIQKPLTSGDLLKRLASE